jgi:ATP-dependent DNA helicase RecG
MVVHRSAEAMAQFQQWLDRLARPIEFASRDAFARLPTVKNLSTYVSSQILHALSHQVYPKSIEAALLKLRALFEEDQQRFTLEEQQRRLREAAAILRTLREATEDQGRVWEEPEALTVPQPAPSKSTRDLWTVPIRFAKGVGPQRASTLQRLGIETVEDALWTVPWRYEDRSVMTPIGQLVPGMVTAVCGTVVKNSAKRTRNRRFTVLEIGLEDQTGRLQAVFFNQPYLEQIFAVGKSIMMSGRVIAGKQGWMVPRMDVSQYEVVGEGTESTLHVGRIVPIYHETKGWTSRQMRVLMRGLVDEHAADLQDILPVPIRARQRLLPVQEAVVQIHFPKAGADLAALELGKSPVHRRLAFEELFLLQMALAARQRSVQVEKKRLHFNPRTPLLDKLGRVLPFTLTTAQDQVIREIFRDMIAPRPMNRLVQGDVGSGKTVVALHAIVLACGSGYQAALMAPTEILAEQHYRNLSPLLHSLGVNAALLRGSDKAATKKNQITHLASGRIQVAIGTHALIQKGVAFKSLGLAVVDEQHKFGVLQRKTLIEKGYGPDVSIIHTLPPGRKPVRTFLFGEAQRRRAYQILRDELHNKRQVYVVYPLVEESEKTDLQAAIQGAERLQEGELKEFRVGVLHGRMKQADKEAVMTDFTEGKIQVLVATTVIEVGVDVPNATVMMIEHAERFGLAQLHQLRGRVGRAGYQSYCLLMAATMGRNKTLPGKRPTGNQESASLVKERLEALVRSNDGFVIAEEDLRIRGPGEFFGFRQWGMPEFRVANIVRDGDLLHQARLEAFSLLKQDPQLTASAHQGIKEAMLRKWQTKLELGSIS